MNHAHALYAAAFIAAGGTAHAAVWTVDNSKSSITFSGTQTGQIFNGTFTKFSSLISFNPAKLQTCNVLIVIAPGSAKTGDTQRDEALPGADWFDASIYPEAKFKATAFKVLGGDHYEADGTLTIRNVSKPVALPFTFTQTGNQATATGSLQIKRTDYGVGQGDWANGDWVGLNVTVTFNLVATAKN